MHPPKNGANRHQVIFRNHLVGNQLVARKSRLRIGDVLQKFRVGDVGRHQTRVGSTARASGGASATAPMSGLMQSPLAILEGRNQDGVESFEGYAIRPKPPKPVPRRVLRKPAVGVC